MDALRFFDGELAELPHAVELVRVLLHEGYRTGPIFIGDAEEAFLLGRLSYHRVVPQLNDAIAEGRVAASEVFRTAVARMSIGIAMTGLRLEHMLVEVGELFSASGVEFLVLKGLATGRLDHPRPGSRQAADVDILVRPGDHDRAGTVLMDAGFQLRPETEVSLMDKGKTWTGRHGDSLDVHARLHTAGRPLPDEWWRNSDTFDVAGHQFRALSRAGRMGHAASHFALSYPNHRVLSSLLDLAVTSRSASAYDRQSTDRFLHQVGVSDIVSRVTNRAAVLLDEPGVVVGRRGSRPMDLALRRAYDRPDLDKVALKLAKTLGMPRADQRRVLRNWIAPTTDFLTQGGYRSRRDRITQIIRRTSSGNRH